VSDGLCFEYACVREKVCRYSSVSEENEREGTESSFYEGGPFVGERDKRDFTIYINKAVSYLSPVSTVQILNNQIDRPQAEGSSGYYTPSFFLLFSFGTFLSANLLPPSPLQLLFLFQIH
jgi:hypothetical protein